MKKWIIRALSLLVFVLLTWTGLTLWVDREGPSKLEKFTSPDDSLRVLLVYDPDPIYNLDEQICKSIGRGLSSQRVSATVATVRAAGVLKPDHFNAVVVLANTYNWTPDASIVSYVKDHPQLKTMPVVAVTIGSGSTETSSKRFREILSSEGIRIIDEHEWWLMRPNDESRMNEENVKVATDQAFSFGQQIATRLMK